ncbi:hypothetical protein HT031_006764 [Scenedesmus sp. PABB004]|nr:hypothetical protein HT031_006764 [Scenedesmus sp. PABB004]
MRTAAQRLAGALGGAGAHAPCSPLPGGAPGHVLEPPQLWELHRATAPQRARADTQPCGQQLPSALLAAAPGQQPEWWGMACPGGGLALALANRDLAACLDDLRRRGGAAAAAGAAAAGPQARPAVPSPFAGVRPQQLAATAEPAAVAPPPVPAPTPARRSRAPPSQLPARRVAPAGGVAKKGKLHSSTRNRLRLAGLEAEREALASQAALLEAAQEELAARWARASADLDASLPRLGALQAACMGERAADAGLARELAALLAELERLLAPPREEELGRRPGAAQPRDDPFAAVAALPLADAATGAKRPRHAGGGGGGGGGSECLAALLSASLSLEAPAAKRAGVERGPAAQLAPLHTAASPAPRQRLLRQQLLALVCRLAGPRAAALGLSAARQQQLGALQQLAGELQARAATRRGDRAELRRALAAALCSGGGSVAACRTTACGLAALDASAQLADRLQASLEEECAAAAAAALQRAWGAW